MGKRYSQLTNKATEADLTVGNVGAIDTAEGAKKFDFIMPVNYAMGRKVQIVSGRVNAGGITFVSDNTRFLIKYLPVFNGMYIPEVAGYDFYVYGLNAAGDTLENKFGWVQKVSYADIIASDPDIALMNIVVRKHDAQSSDISSLLSSFADAFLFELKSEVSLENKISKRIEKKFVDLNDKSLWHSGYINSANGFIRPSATRYYSDMFAFTPDSTILATFVDVASVIRIFAYDRSGAYIGLGSSRSIENVITEYPNAYFFRACVYDVADINDFSFSQNFETEFTADDVLAINQLKSRVDAIEEYSKLAIDLNDKSFWHEGKINSTTGAIESGSGRLYTDLFILTPDSVIDYDVAEGVTLTHRMVAWAEDGTYLGMKDTESVAEMIAQYPTAYSFRYYFTGSTGIVLSVDDLDDACTFTGDIYAKQDSIVDKVNELERRAAKNTLDFLAEKKWYACGDSFTAGSGVPNLSEGKYKGYPCVYPYYIGNRTNINVFNIAVSGSTLADRAGATESNCFSYPNGKYTKIPADADYITLKFGINDNHQNTPIGEDDDATNATFKGAWNVVLQEIISTHPLAHIGIIVTNGCTDPAYPEATIAMARKYGIPYLDEDGGDQVPLLLRTTRKPYVLDSIKQIKYDAMIVGDQGGEINRHPNEYAHEFESRFVESWMRTI